jgi:hypothetical protein
LRTASLLDRAVALEAAERVYRVTLDRERSRRIQRIRHEIGDGPELGEALSFLDEGVGLDISSLSDLLTGCGKSRSVVLPAQFVSFCAFITH